MEATKRRRRDYFFGGGDGGDVKKVTNSEFPVPIESQKYLIGLKASLRSEDSATSSDSEVRFLNVPNLVGRMMLLMLLLQLRKALFHGFVRMKRQDGNLPSGRKSHHITEQKCAICPVRSWFEKEL